MFKKIKITAAALILLLCMTACSIVYPSESAAALPDITHEELASKTWSAEVSLLGEPHKVSVTFPEKGRGIANVDGSDLSFNYSINGRELTASTSDGEYNVTAKMSDDGSQLTVNYIATITMTAE